MYGPILINLSFSPGIIFYEIGIETLSVENCQSKDVKVFGDSKGILLVFIGERFGSRVLETINMLLKLSGGHVRWFKS